MALSFLDLPSEIRNVIYQLLLTHDTPIQAYTFQNLSPREHTCLNLHPAMLLLCHKIHDEASSILYGCNRFQAHPSWLTDVTFAVYPNRPIMSTRYIAFIRRFHLRVRLDCDPFYTPAKLAEAFSGLDELEVEVFQTSFGASDYRVLECFSVVRGVKRAKVHGSVRKPFSDWLEKIMQSAVETALSPRNSIFFKTSCFEKPPGYFHHTA
ncbi:hypothetical protein MMC14_006453 [Varicellaria rhodocarpa]|nr:hypothetical protein [Varicellaria rhodocarpa]